jgi:hypothetical protein
MKRAANGSPAQRSSPAWKPRTSAHPLQPEVPGPPTADLAARFQQLCAQAAIKDNIRAGHWKINGVILHIYSLREIQSRMDRKQMLEMIKIITGYLATPKAVPRSD